MASSGNNDGPGPERSSSIRDRRGSLTPGSSLSEFLSSSRQPQIPSAYPGPITTAAAQANQRRLSMSSANGSPPQLPSFRRGSVSSISSTSSMLDENAIEEGDASGSPKSPFARRMSWGARAFRDVRLPTTPRVPQTPPGASSPTVSRGFWLDNNTKAPNSYPTDPAFQQRRQSMPPPPVASMPAPKDQTHDHVQERMLRNELYID